MALATSKTVETCLSDTLSKVYEVALCARVQETNAGDAKLVRRCCWRSRRIWGCLGAFARRWRRDDASRRSKTHSFSTTAHVQYSPNLLSRARMPHRASSLSQTPQNTSKSACCASCVVARLCITRNSPLRTHKQRHFIGLTEGIRLASWTC